MSRDFGEYDIQQVCENGHQINPCIRTYSENIKKHCQKCGASTLTSCPDCNESIPGALIAHRQTWNEAAIGGSHLAPISNPRVPSYCHNCGKPYPWTKKKIETAIQNFVEFGDLNDEEKKTIEQDVENIAKDVPQAELSAQRIKRIWERGTAVGYEVIMEFASRTAAKILKGP